MSLIRLEKRPGHRTKNDKTTIALITNLFRLKFCNEDDMFRQFRKYNVEIGELKQAKPKRDQNYAPKPKLLPFKTREERRLAFWYIVSRRTDVFKNVFNIIYDDFKFFWAADSIRPPNLRDPEMDMLDYKTKENIPSELLWPEKPEEMTRDKEITIYMHVTSSAIENGTPLRVMLGARKGFSASDREGVEASTFGKALFIQKFRFPIHVCAPGSFSPAANNSPDFITLFKKMSDTFTAYKNSVYKIPRDPSKYPGYDRPIAPAVHAWIGLYASLKHMEDYHPVMNFGLVNQLFRDLDMNLVMYYLKVINEFNGLSDGALENEIRERRLSMSEDQRKKFSATLKDTRVKGKPVLVFDRHSARHGEIRWDLVTRHYKFLGLIEHNPFAASPNEPTPPYVQRPGPPIEWEIEPAVFGPTANIMRVPCGKRIEMSLARLYSDFGHPLDFPDLPLAEVQVAAGRKNLVPVELLFTHDTPQAYTKMLSFEMKNRFIRVCTRPAIQMKDPGENRMPVSHKQFTESIKRSMKFAHPDSSSDEQLVDPFLAEFGTYVDPENVECEGQILEAPIIKSSDGEIPPLAREHRGFSLIKFLEVPPKKVYFSLMTMWDQAPSASDRGPSTDNTEPVQPVEDVKQFYKNLAKVCRDRGIQVDTGPPLWTEWEVHTEEYQRELPMKIREIKADFDEIKREDKDAQTLLICISKRKLDLYGYMKAEMNRQEVVSQVIDCDTVRKAIHKGEEGIYWHLSMKINAKLGGVTHALSAAEGFGQPRCRIGDPALCFLKEPTIFLGIDVTHPTAHCGYEGLSIASIVANYDIAATRYSCEIIPQVAAKETIVNFDDNRFALTITKFVEYTGKHPKHIVILRDGVSEGELQNTASKELMWIEKALKNHFSETSITLTYVCVQKRHFVRVYPKYKDNADGEAGNVPAGTLVDSVIVHPELYDFYLASHYGQIGTTRPARYIVLYDSWKLGVDQMTDMMHNLCYLYSRCAHPVSLPTPLYYAHLVCEQAKEMYKGFVKSGALDSRTADYMRETNPNKEFEQMQKIQKFLKYTTPGMPWL
ncbi:unnamed protein product, partial [Mesorhabditis belari]|uniref:Piwi domain-containing protein n=1 Tax=Mesorhabditis belari TaxID=2138241 RepID=A0AAF3J9E5_9BILA